VIIVPQLTNWGYCDNGKGAKNDSPTKKRTEIVKRELSATIIHRCFTGLSAIKIYFSKFE